MKRTLEILTVSLVLATTTTFAQTTLKEYKAGHIYYVSLPDYMGRTAGINDAATMQYKSEVKEVYGFIIEDSKEELQLVELNYPSINDFYDAFIKDFLKDQEKRNISTPQYQKKGEVNFVECDASYYDKESKIEIYYGGGCRNKVFLLQGYLLGISNKQRQV